MSKRYIEDVLPLVELNKYAQKGGGVGSINAMHPYFARRPLTASRAMTLAALIDAPQDEAERQKLEQLLIQLSSEEWPDMPDLLEQAKELIRQSHKGRTPRVLDPFAGGGSMPLEAMRLGCETTALDLNPVAYLALIATLVYPQKFGHRNDNPIYTQAPKATETKTLPEIAQSADGKTSQLVQDIRYWAQWVLDQTQAQMGDCFPNDLDGAVPVAYLWAKTIRCPHCGGEVPLIKRRWLQKGERHDDVAYRLVVDKTHKRYEVEILRGAAATGDKPEQGTIRGAIVECIYCGIPTERERIAEQGKAGHIGEHLLVVVVNHDNVAGRAFRTTTECDHQAYALAIKKLNEAELEGYDFWGSERLLAVIPDEPTPHEQCRATAIRQYGVVEWGQMFNKRQLLTLITLGRQIRSLREMLYLEKGEYGNAIALYVDFLLSKQAAYNSRGSWWQPEGLKIAPVMARRDIPVTWDYAEANTFSQQATSWNSFIESIWRTIESISQIMVKPSEVRLGSSTQLPEEWSNSFDAVITDPPYYDSVNYGDLSDYYYVWHKRIVGDEYPEAFVTEVTPKDQEIIQDVFHGGNKKAAKDYYETSMAHAFTEMRRVLKSDGIAVIMFAHKKSSAWETLIGALVHAGFQVTASWPLNTEGRRLQSYRAVALASSVYLVCRKRTNSDKTTGYLEDIEIELRQNIRRYLERFWAAGIGGADFFMSAIGPGLSVFSRYAKVERYDGSRVRVSDFLDLVRHEVANFAIERIIGEKGFTERLDAPTQFYLLWRWGYSDWDVPDGEALLLSTAVGIDLKILMGRLNFVHKVKGKLRLLGPGERAEGLEKVTQRILSGGVVPLIDVIHKACLLWQADNREELSALIAANSGEIWPVTQAIVELLPKNNAERNALMSLLGTRLDLESRARDWSERHKPQPQIVQLRLWGNEHIS